MEAKILIIRVKARNSQLGLKKIKKQYPNCRLVSFKNCQNYKGSICPDWNNREIDIAIVDDAAKVWAN